LVRAAVLAGCLSLILGACGQDTPQTRTELCQEIQRLTCHQYYQECGGSPAFEPACDDEQGGIGGVSYLTCCTAINCASAREVTEVEAEACLDAAAEGYTCERIDQGWVPAACKG